MCTVKCAPVLAHELTSIFHFYYFYSSAMFSDAVVLVARNVEELPTYKDLYPQNSLIPASPPPYTALSSHSITSDQAAASADTNCRVVITQPNNSRSHQPASRYQVKA